MGQLFRNRDHRCELKSRKKKEEQNGTAKAEYSEVVVFKGAAAAAAV
ncbi:MAG TPA: hypothetical protein PLP04_19190 [Bryobacteraceae bacterium]|nr:hypothetical protein [Bryobacteraceae bacterium]HPQ17364.1 hypothetical protein [Bryobacteraceae bacterium]